VAAKIETGNHVYRGQAPPKASLGLYHLACALFIWVGADASCQPFQFLACQGTNALEAPAGIPSFTEFLAVLGTVARSRAAYASQLTGDNRRTEK
jgi:hypothetical protein